MPSASCPRLRLVALLLFSWQFGKANTITESISAGPGASISAQQSLQFLVLDDDGGSLYGMFSHFIGSCEPIDPTAFYHCTGSVDDHIQLLNLSTLWGADMNLVYDFDDLAFDQEKSSDESLTFCGVLGLGEDFMCNFELFTPGVYSLTLSINDSESAVENAIAVPFSDFVTATVVGDISIPVPEPALWPLCLIALLALGVERSRRPSPLRY